MEFISNKIVNEAVMIPGEAILNKNHGRKHTRPLTRTNKKYISVSKKVSKKM